MGRCIVPRVTEDRVIVIGSGPPGAAAATFLCRAGARVLLLEGGSERSALGLTVRVGGFTVFKLRRRLKERQGVVATGDAGAKLFEELAPGGLTNHWSGAVPRFSRDDFADARRAGQATTWPIDYDDLAPWYDNVEPLLRIAGSAQSCPQLPGGRVRRARELGSDWTRVAEAAVACGRALAVMPYAYGAETTARLTGTVFNSYERLIRPELRAGRLSVRFNARVSRLEWSPATRRVESVVFRDTRTGSETRMRCRAVVLAAGAVGSAEILLASTSADFPQGLGNTHGILGRYFHDHPLGKLVVDVGKPVSFHPPHYLTRPTLDKAPPLHSAACMQWTGSDMLARSLVKRSPGRLAWLGYSVFGTMAPTRENWIEIDPSRPGRDGTPGLVMHMSYASEATQALNKAREDVTYVLDRAGLNPRVRVWHVEPVGESKHFGGTCRMHASPDFGMVDGWNRMHAVRNVAVVDSAAFTTGPEKNPVLTAMALAARAGDRLAGEMKAGDL